MSARQGFAAKQQIRLVKRQRISPTAMGKHQNLSYVRLLMDPQPAKEAATNVPSQRAAN